MAVDVSPNAPIVISLESQLCWSECFIVVFVDRKGAVLPRNSPLFLQLSNFLLGCTSEIEYHTCWLFFTRTDLLCSLPLCSEKIINFGKEAFYSSFLTCFQANRFSFHDSSSCQASHNTTLRQIHCQAQTCIIFAEPLTGSKYQILVSTSDHVPRVFKEKLWKKCGWGSGAYLRHSQGLFHVTPTLVL